MSAVTAADLSATREILASVGTWREAVAEAMFALDFRTVDESNAWLADVPRLPPPPLEQLMWAKRQLSLVKHPPRPKSLAENKRPAGRPLKHHFTERQLEIAMAAIVAIETNDRKVR